MPRPVITAGLAVLAVLLVVAWLVPAVAWFLLSPAGT